MSENRDTTAIFSASHCADEFALISRALCFSKVRFILAFYHRNLVFSLRIWLGIRDTPWKTQIY